MDLTNAFKSEIFRPLAILLVPGLFATAPFLILFSRHNPELLALLTRADFGGIAVVIVIATAAGLVLENIGSRIERGMDQCIEERYLPAHHHNWDEYLQQTDISNIVAQRYLGPIVTRAKFILSMLPALASAIIGVWVLQRLSGLWTFASVVISLFVMFAILLFLFRELIALLDVLGHLRWVILKSLGKGINKWEYPCPRVRVFAFYAILNVVGFKQRTIKKWAVKTFRRPTGRKKLH